MLHSVDAPSTLLSLERRLQAARILAHSVVTAAHVNQHRYEETINGRAYLIEVSAVGRDRWRAQIARKPGGSGALMPFYGTTPDEAAGQLSRWLLLATGQPKSGL